MTGMRIYYATRLLLPDLSSLNRLDPLEVLLPTRLARKALARLLWISLNETAAYPSDDPFGTSPTK